MLNHADDFNCDHSFQVELGKQPILVVRATRAISAGDECCYSYVPPHLSLEDRRLLLKKTYGFDNKVLGSGFSDTDCAER